MDCIWGDNMSRQFLFSLTKKDFNIQTFTSGGPGGQHQNRVESGIRISHPESGAVGEARTTRSQLQNKKLALQRLTNHPKFKLWLNQKYWEWKTGKTIDQIVDEQMDIKNIKIEVRDENGKWIEYDHQN